MLCCRCDSDQAEVITNVINPRGHLQVLGAAKGVPAFRDALAQGTEAGQDYLKVKTKWVASAGLMTFDDAVKAILSPNSSIHYIQTYIAPRFSQSSSLILSVLAPGSICLTTKPDELDADGSAVEESHPRLPLCTYAVHLMAGHCMPTSPGMEFPWWFSASLNDPRQFFL
ncbi:hypothetical protein F5Y19DRAFT_482323 [Xylariaceae sp. FL1651]|nr:hypothetical protein F5Y19DRAFT_482323 [Xylariaceae sp. FL1651]